MHLTATPMLPYDHKGSTKFLTRPNGAYRTIAHHRSLLLKLAVFMFLMLVLSLVVLENKNWHQRPLSQGGASQRSQDQGRLRPQCVATPPKRILLWTSFWGNYSEQWEKIFFRQVSRQCPVSSCEIVYDHRNFDTADAVLFHILDFNNETDLPPSRPLGQPWVAFSMEAPPVVNLFHVDYARLNGMINWTMTYRLDSDIVTPYGTVTANNLLESDQYDIETQLESPNSDEGPHGEASTDRDYWGDKSADRMVVWMVSHCATDGRREWFVKELVKHINVHVYGRCGFKKCGKNISIKTLGTFDQETCNKEIRSYFFYLALENSICEDYVTEKFFMALTMEVIPVVFGGTDYAAIAPPRSYINALDFPSPKLLAKALIAIASNRTLYNSFFTWKGHYTVQLGHPFLPMVCDLCAKLNGEPTRHSSLLTNVKVAPDGLKTRSVGRDPVTGSYSDLQGWFVAGSSCRRWWAGPSDYRKHQPLEPQSKEPNDKDIMSHAEEDNNEGNQDESVLKEE